ncbi:transposase [Clostridioides sp. ZZV14-6345]|uniref:transposase n=1 Tax=Clostridioides sp. ZZV14-6345 TaxID=2811496 RepID=UPI001D11F32F|nr:transposase [Clostridioides sp. ZZV14-6345]
MISKVQLNLTCKDTSFYSFIRKENFKQNKALNTGLALMHSYSILENVSGGEEVKIEKEIKRTLSKIENLKKRIDTNGEKINLEQKKINTNLVKLSKLKENRLKLKDDFRDNYFESDSLQHVLKTMNIIQEDTADLVIEKLNKDYSLNRILKGEESLKTYNENTPLMINSKKIIFKYIDNNFYIKNMFGYKVKVKNNISFLNKYNKFVSNKYILSRIDENFNHDIDNTYILDFIINNIVNKKYNIFNSCLRFTKDNLLIMEFLIDMPEVNDKYIPIKKRTLGVDLGMRNIAYLCLNDNISIHKKIGTSDKFIKARKIINFHELKNSDKLNTVKLYKKVELETYSNRIINHIIDFAKYNFCEYINLEKLQVNEFGKNLFDGWTYANFQKNIEHEAAKEGIIVRYINPSFTSQKCSKCGYIHKSNHILSDFKCSKCGLKLDSDYNAAINIARSNDFM